MPYYAVRKGRTIGIYEEWQECEKQVKGFSGASHKKCDNYDDARDFMVSGETTGGSSPTTKRTPGKHQHASPDVGDESRYDIVYCRGSCKENGKPNAVAAIGVWWGPGDSRNLAERCPGTQTSNRAELMAIIRALETAPKSEQPLLVKSDSSYAVSCINGPLEEWCINGYRTANGNRVINSVLFQFFAKLRKAAKVDIIVQLTAHIDGHQGHEEAKRLAEQGIRQTPFPDRNWNEECEVGAS